VKPSTRPADVALMPVLTLLRADARHNAEAADNAYSIADTFAAERALAAEHTRRANALWQHATALRQTAGLMRDLVSDPDATAAQRIELVNTAHSLMSHHP